MTDVLFAIAKWPRRAQHALFLSALLIGFAALSHADRAPRHRTVEMRWVRIGVSPALSEATTSTPLSIESSAPAP